ncbi:MAG TPA: hypothetical protein VHK23_08325 [Miltoncostaeaceae bacterium]|nr:hypothetical protein [Miltoncostaeaceae bacterium]
MARDASPTGVTTEGGRLVAEALAAALYDVAEALRTDAAEAPPQPARRGDGNRVGERAGRSLGSMSTRAMSEAAAAIAAAVVPAIVERIDVNALLAKVDVDALVSRIDVNRILDTVDVDELVGRVDMAALAREALEGIDLGEIIQDSTASIATDTLEAIRIQAMRADGLLARIVDLPLRRRGRQTALAPRGRAR